MRPLTVFYRLLLDVLLPTFCLCCRKEGSSFCDSCLRHLVAGLSPRSDRVSGPLGLLLSASEYREKDLLPRMIHAFKYENIRDLARPLGVALAYTLRPVLPGNKHPVTVLVPVPLHPSRQKSRGYNQSALLAAGVSRTLGIPVFPLLKRVHFHAPQMELSREERLNNVRGAFTLDQQVISDFNSSLTCDAASIQVILVDDVATTLATLTDCARALTQAGFGNIIALTLARVS